MPIQENIASLAVSYDFWPEFRGWLTLIGTIVGGVIAYKAYNRGQNQRRLDNSFKFIDLFYKTVGDGGIKKWKALTHHAFSPNFEILADNPDDISNPVPVKHRDPYYCLRFYTEGLAGLNGFPHSLKDTYPEYFTNAQLFSENSPDGGTLIAICELFNLIGYEFLNHSIELRIIYFELGHYLQTAYVWASSYDTDGPALYVINGPTRVAVEYPYFEKMVKKAAGSLRKWPFRTAQGAIRDPLTEAYFPPPHCDSWIDKLLSVLFKLLQDRK